MKRRQNNTTKSSVSELLVSGIGRLMATVAYAAALVLLPLLLLLLMGCSERYPSFNEVDRFRVLSVRAEPPELSVGEQAELDALLHVPDDAPVAYKWSWCPFAADPRDGRRCIISEAELNQMLSDFISDPNDFVNGGVTIPGSLGDLLGDAGDLLGDAGDLLDTAGAVIGTAGGVPVDAESLAAVQDIVNGGGISFDLGDAPTARFVHAIPPQVFQLLCDSLASGNIPALIELPGCGDKINVVIRLEVTSDGTTLYAVKTLPLFGDEPRDVNRNPVVEAVHLFRGKDGAEEVTDEGGIPALVRGETYRMVADVPPELIDVFTPPPTGDNPAPEPQLESLFLTWYVVGGDTEAGRTTFFDGEIPLATLRNNEWLIPKTVDYPEEDAWLYLVLQDERGGIDWLSRPFTLKE